MAIFNHTKPESARINELLERDSTLIRLEMLGGSGFNIFARPDLDGPNDGGHVVNAAAFAAGPAADEAFVHFDRVFPANAITIWPNHSGTQLMKNLKGGLITGKSQLALKLKS